MSSGRPWDDGVQWRTAMVTPPDGAPIDVAYVRDLVLRTAGDGAEDGHLRRLILMATEAAEQDTGRSIMPQTRSMVLDGFPCRQIVLQGPPLVAVTTIVYVDTDGVEQTLTGSPEEFQTVPSGLKSKGLVVPLYGETWPSTRCQPDAVTVTYTAGYESADHVPELIRQGIALMVGEMYKQRTLSVHAVHNTPSVLQLRRFWRKVYG